MNSCYVYKLTADEPIQLLDRISAIYEEVWNDYSTSDDFEDAEKELEVLKRQLLNHCK